MNRLASRTDQTRAADEAVGPDQGESGAGAQLGDAAFRAAHSPEQCEPDQSDVQLDRSAEADQQPGREEAAQLLEDAGRGRELRSRSRGTSDACQCRMKTGQWRRLETGPP